MELETVMVVAVQLQESSASLVKDDQNVASEIDRRRRKRGRRLWMLTPLQLRLKKKPHCRSLRKLEVGQLVLHRAHHLNHIYI